MPSQLSASGYRAEPSRARYDMYSEPVRRAAMITAERTAQPTASGKVVLLQGGGVNLPGFVVYMRFSNRSLAGAAERVYLQPFTAQISSPPRSSWRVPEAMACGCLTAPGADPACWRKSRAPARTAKWPPNVCRSPVPRGGSSYLVLWQWAFGLSMCDDDFRHAVASLLIAVVRMLTQQAIEDEASLRWFEEQASIRNR